MTTIKNEKGIVLIMSFFLIVVLLGLMSVFILRVVHESAMVVQDKNLTQAFYIAEASHQIALNQLDTLINTYMNDTINNMNASTVSTNAQNYVTSGDSLGFLILTVQDNGIPQLTLNGAQAEYARGATTYGNGQYSYKIIITEKTDPQMVTSSCWDFLYKYQVEAVGEAGNVSKQVNLNGDFTVRVQQENFARYALFTNNQTMPNGTRVWFTDNTNFAGPLHTNGRYNFAFNPSGTFYNKVVQKEQAARYYNNGYNKLLDDDHNGTRDVPTFEAGFTRGADTISLSSSTQKQDLISQASGGNSYSTYGIYLPNDGSNLTGGIYVKGNSAVSLSVDGDNNAVYTIQQWSTTKTITVDKANQQTSVSVNGGTATIYSGVPDGVDDVGTLIFVDGTISGLSGTVQEETELTISSNDDIVISNNLTYSNYTPATGTPGDTDYVAPSAEGAVNVLGLVSWEGDVLIGRTAPDDVNIHGTILAQNGIFQVDDYDDQWLGPRGDATILGGVITDNYGAFGQFSGSTGNPLSGYGRNFVYDNRMQSGTAPPYFPSLSTFIAFTNDIMDKIIWREGSLE